MQKQLPFFIDFMLKMDTFKTQKRLLQKSLHNTSCIFADKSWRTSMRQLEQKNIIVTGANRGIGLAVVKNCAKNGANVYACARTKSDEFEKEMESLSKEYDVFIKVVYFDLNNQDEVKAKIQKIAKDKVAIDGLVNNAGIPYGNSFLMTPMEELNKVFQTNFFGQIHMMQLVARMMMRKKSGSIVNIASVGGMEATEGYLAYGSSKAALIYATKVLSKEIGTLNVRVNAISPGLTDTQMGHFKDEDELKKVLDRTAMKRMANPEEIADACVYLLSDQASYITGQILAVDGGRLR